MASARVCITYCKAQTSQLPSELIVKLVADLRAVKVEVIEGVLDNQHTSDEHFLEFLIREFNHCQWLILVDRPEALYPLRVQTAVSTALDMVGQTPMKGVLRVLTLYESYPDEQEIPVHCKVTQTFDARQDYQQALHGLLLMLSFDKLANKPSERYTRSLLQQGKGNGVHQAHEKRGVPPGSVEKPLPFSGPRLLRKRRLFLPLLQVLHRPRLTWVPAPISLPRSVRVMLTILIILVAFMAYFTFNAVNSAAFRAGKAAAYVSAQSTATAFIHTHATAIADTVIKSQDPYLPFAQEGRVVFNDPLLRKSHSNTWTSFSTSSTSSDCTFSDAGYEVSQSQAEQLTYCVNVSVSLTNFAYQVTMTLLQGDQGGLIFCVNNIDNNDIEHARFYYFHVKADANSSGNWAYEVGWIDLMAPSALPIHTDHSPYIHSQSGQANLLAIAVDNSIINFYINKHNVYQIADTTYTSGAVGIFAKDDTNATDIMFRDATVWQA